MSLTTVLKVWVHDVSNASNIGHLYDVTTHVDVVRMANDKCQASNIGTGTQLVFCSRVKGCFQCRNANYSYCRMFASNVGLFDALYS